MLLLLTTFACSGDGGGVFNRPEKDNSTDNGTDDSDPGEVDPEGDCGNGLDDDGDGDTDCADSDCATYEVCTWPDVISHRSVFDFKGRRVTCETWAGDFDEDVEDCITEFTSELAVVDDADICTQCDRTYEGAFEYQRDTCGTTYGDGSALPTSGRFGFIFAENKWVLFGKDETTGTWEEGLDLTAEGDRYTWNNGAGEPIYYDVGDCDNDPLYVGDVQITLNFTPR